MTQLTSSQNNNKRMRSLLFVTILVLLSCSFIMGADFPSISGHFRYRSFFNLPGGNVTADQLIFARGDFYLNITDASPEGRHLEGILIGGDRNSPGKYWELTVSGDEYYSSWLGAPSVQAYLVALGINGTISSDWHYEYIVQSVPHWDQGQAQYDSFVGSVVRVCCHDPIGLVANLASTRADDTEELWPVRTWQSSKKGKPFIQTSKRVKIN